jgi:hypothetical protein
MRLPCVLAHHALHDAGADAKDPTHLEDAVALGPQLANASCFRSFAPEHVQAEINSTFALNHTKKCMVLGNSKKPNNWTRNFPGLDQKSL